MDTKKLDIVVVEATAITEEGFIVPGATPELIQMADKIIVEVNTRISSFEGLHDLNIMDLPPRRKPYLIISARSSSAHKQKHTQSAIPIDTDKIIALVESNRPDNTGPNHSADATANAIAGHLIEFLEHEVKNGRLPAKLLPLQSGIGTIANAIIGGLARESFEGVTVRTEVLQDTFLEFSELGKLKFASATSVRFSPDGFDRFYANWASYHDKLLLRSQ
ncbi:hypothetical protein BC936DRAFT_137994 [Jimgerdemannia flammicorona]|uniref:Acetyl-CoA hydrolase n=1 Tax=Jimgerdemannia flammicorona TaxID=994334 RepID=A0A433CW06_9FUNG|nr:hypothetical protein BC936DRAFT_137994 [Jimgerdemannia flammicorona]